MSIPFAFLSRPIRTLRILASGDSCCRLEPGFPVRTSQRGDAPLSAGPIPCISPRSGALALLAAAVLGLANAVSAAPLVTHFTQSTYDVDVRPGSDLLGASGFSGIQLTSYTTDTAITGSGVFLEAFPGQFKSLSQTLKLHFGAHTGFTFTSVSMSHLLSYFQVEGGYRSMMSWWLDTGDGSPVVGATPLIEDFFWFHGGSFSDLTQASPWIAVNDDAFDLDVTLFYTVSGYPQGCSSTSGVCAQLSANAVKIWALTEVATAPGPGAVPEPASLALILGALGLMASGRRRRYAGGAD